MSPDIRYITTALRKGATFPTLDERPQQESVILSVTIFMIEMKALFSPELREGPTVCKTKKSHNNSERGGVQNDQESAKISTLTMEIR